MPAKDQWLLLLVSPPPQFCQEPCEEPFGSDLEW